MRKGVWIGLGIGCGVYMLYTVGVSRSPLGQ
jgi:hypothetical protein